MTYSANKPATSSSAESQPTQTNPEPRTRKGRKQEHQPKTARDYLPLFKRVVKAYLNCLSYTRWPLNARSDDPFYASSRSVAARRYAGDIERSAWQVLDTVQLLFAWGNLVRRYGGLRWYEDVPEEVEQSVILAVCPEWERFELHRVRQYFEHRVVNPYRPGTTAGFRVGPSEIQVVPGMQPGAELSCKSNQEVDAK